MQSHIIVVGAGIGGLVAAIDLATAGVKVTLVDRHKEPGGKVASQAIGDQTFDAGPTVLTLRHVFDEIFADAGTRLEDYLTLWPQHILARHGFYDGTWLDLFDSPAANGAAISRVFGTGAARAYARFSAYSQTLYEHAAAPFIYAPRPTFTGALRQHGLATFAAPWTMDSRRTMRRAIESFFVDYPALAQLFARYATYSGASPDRAPATFNLIAHVEQAGVWTPKGGMRELPRALWRLASEKLGVTFLGDTDVSEICVEKGVACGIQLASGERLASDGVVANVDVAALENGRLGKAAKLLARPVSSTPGLSAVTLICAARVNGPPLAHHNVLFAPPAPLDDEFFDIFESQVMPRDPSIYLCAQDRVERPSDDASSPDATKQAERLFFLFNAPALPHVSYAGVSERCRLLLTSRLQNLGITLDNQSFWETRTPQDFARRFPGSDGRLYGRPPHSWRALFDRWGSKTPIQGLYLTGGSVHPGPGLPMAAQSGRLAAAAVLDTLPLTTRSPPAATRGGISMRKATTAPTPSASLPL